MITYDEAYKMVMNKAVRLETETVVLAEAAGRVLAEDVVSDMDMPPFNKSAMDGYACRREDLGKELQVIEEIPAGVVSQKEIGPGQCSKIMTGAPVPDGADCVFMVEFVEELENGVVRFAGEDTSDNICIQGEDVRAGDIVLKAGELITSAHVAVMASVGCTEPLVSGRPRVGIVATGSELVDPSVKPSPGSIRNSNGYQLAVQAQEVGAKVVHYPIAADRVEELDSVIGKAKSENDLVILSGGVSMGDYDLVPGVLRSNGFDFLFDSVAMQPGRPTLFGNCGDVFCCGLPGNPVSTFVVFNILLKPFLYRLMGHEFRPLFVKATLKETIKRKRTIRQSSYPVVFTSSDMVEPVDYHGAAHINAMTFADGLVVLPAGVAEIEGGGEVDVRLL
jgi:molybdopterin molybdotransferase